MTIKSIAKHGDWHSPISQDLVTASSRTLGEPRVSRKAGRVFYTETRRNGDRTIVEFKDSHVHSDILPPNYAAANTVYNYGGSATEALHDGRVIFSNKDNTVKILDPITSKVSHVTGEDEALRYSNFSANDTNPWVLAIEEDHTIDTPEDTVNRIVAINVETNEVKRIVEGADFYYPAEFSHDGTKLAWLEWDHPDQPWYAARLYWAHFSEEAVVGHAHLVAGGLLDSVVEPHWGPDGSLFFGMERSNYRQLFRLRPGDKSATQITLTGLEDAEFGELRLFPGSHTYAPLSEKTLVASAQRNAVSRLVAIDLEDGSWKYIASEEAANQVQFDHLIRLDDSRVLGVFSGTLNTESLWIVDAENPKANKIIRKSQEHQISDSWFSRPELLGVSSKGSPARTVYGFLWMPRNPHWTAEDGALPPLIIATHGGPTGHYGPGLNLRTQYFTSRGYAVFFLNYHGSTGHGRAYRQALWGNWGTIDSDDAVEVANYLVSAGRIRKGSVGCTGLSAGGYHTLTSVTRHPHVYAGAVDVSGICDLVTFNNGTHKLEWNYTDALVVDRDDATEEEKVARYRECSALYHTDKIETPLLILHGKEDTVVPMNQATDVYEALKKQGKDVKLVKVDNDGHVLAKPRSAKIWLDEEEKWWRKTLV